MHQVNANEFLLRKLYCVYLILLGKRTVTAIGIGAAVVIFSGGAIALAWWLRSRPHDSFFDVIG